MDFEKFKLKLNNQPLPVVVDVWAPWCGPCRMIEPSLHKLSQEYAGRVEVMKINADENRELLQALKIYGIPTLLVFQGEQEIMRAVGAQSQASLAKLFDSALTGEPAQRTGMPPSERMLRAAVGLGIILFTWFSQLSAFWYVPGAIILFTAFHDRCPIWQALSPHLARLVEKFIPALPAKP